MTLSEGIDKYYGNEAKPVEIAAAGYFHNLGYEEGKRESALSGQDVWDLFQLCKEVIDEQLGDETSCSYVGTEAMKRFKEKKEYARRTNIRTSVDGPADTVRVGNH